MRSRIDKTIPTIIVSYGLIFISSFLIASNFKVTTFLICWIGFWTLIILWGIWKIESFEITDNRLTKTNFIGLFKRTINLEKLIFYEKKVIDTDHFKNPINVVKWFSKDNRYLVFRKITIVTEGNSKISLDERTINKDDFSRLYDKIKRHKSRNKD